MRTAPAEQPGPMIICRVIFCDASSLNCLMKARTPGRRSHCGVETMKKKEKTNKKQKNTCAPKVVIIKAQGSKVQK